ncbi:porin [Methylocella sp. CPCC 101449]|uniref:porin n=1 Tax=Methylocella sp. CPCC 101449 TaxID=2987531 RepID=UPI0028920F13|nr:porin [Methylocella sp. CPCC 101449]MDT2021444.1 porin [Methylocella sp. CPCC 101449]
MRFTKSLLLGSSAALLAMAGAQAADLPSRKAAPVEYVRVCDAYGEGFYWIPGTDTCLRVGGRVRVDGWYTPSKNAVSGRSTGGGTGTFISSNAVDSTGWYARGIVNMDARTQSAWGTVQTVFSLRLQAASGLGVASPGYTGGVFSGGNANTATIEAAYIRFAGFTVGQATSNFTFLPNLPYGSMLNAAFPSGIRQLAYTATFGGGFSATLAIENRGDLPMSMTANTLGANPFTATGALAGPVAQRLPALVANLRIDQGWGSAMVSGAVLENSATFGNANLAVVGNAGPAIRRTGWAVAGGLKVNLPMLAQGDNVQVWAAYGVGALDYVASNGASANTLLTSNYLGGYLRADRNLTLFCVNAACSAGGSEQTKAFSVTGTLTHYWTPSLRSNLIGSYLRIDPGSVTQNTAWSQGGLSRANVWTAVGQLIWSPVRNFDIGVELSYARLNQNLPLSVPAGLGVLANVNPNNWTGRMRVERQF